MTHARVLAAMLAFGSLAGLPGCGMMNMNHGSSMTTSSAAPAVGPELSPDMVKQIQTTLQQEKDYNGAIDGKWGPDTQASLRSYQQAHNLTATGQVDQPTAAAMHLQTMNNTAPMPATTTGAASPPANPGAATPATMGTTQPPAPPAQ